MAQIIVNEISENYTYSIVSSQFATVALPITAAWGPAYMPPESVYSTSNVDDITDAMLEDTKWLKFESNQAGIESFVATFRGPSSNYRIANDYSYQQALTLLSAGYDVLVCRVCPGAKASNSFDFTSGNTLTVEAKYPGTFGNNLKIKLTKVVTTAKTYWNAIIYIVDPVSKNTTAAENLTFKFDYDDTIPTLDEIKSNLVTFKVDGTITDSSNQPAVAEISLAGGTDVLDTGVVNIGTDYYAPQITEPTYAADTYYTISWSSANPPVPSATALTSQEAIHSAFVAHTTVYKKFVADGTTITTPESAAIADYATALMNIRYTSTEKTSAGYSYGCGSLVLQNISSLSAAAYTDAWTVFKNNSDTVKAKALAHMEWVYNAAFIVIQLLQNKLDYNPNRLYTPWDDQNTLAINGTQITNIQMINVSPLHRIIMDTAFKSRCATGMLDFPKSLIRSLVYNDSNEANTEGYAQKLSHIVSTSVTAVDVNIQLYVTHSALFGPWAPYKLTGLSKQVSVSPSFLALLIHRAQLLNQATQYEWLLPDNRKHNLRIGEPDYKVPTKLRDSWQSIYGLGVNVIAAIPDLGINQWGNSTLFDVPPATYQALADLSTRWLVNAIEDVVYRTGISITFNYNNENAYSKFYVGVTPLLDSMLNAGAIEDYKVQMSPDLDALGQVKARSVIGTIALVVSGVINDITVDLIALPPGTDLSAFGS